MSILRWVKVDWGCGKDDDRVASCVVVGDGAGDGGVDGNRSGSCFAGAGDGVRCGLAVGVSTLRKYFRLRKVTRFDP